MDLLFVLALGAVVGSFLNVCIDRLPRGGSLVSPPSHCDACGRRLSALDLVPILSYVVLRGRCRTCRATIPARVLAVEIGTGAVFSLIYLRFGPTLQTVLSAGFAAWLTVIAVIDIEHRRILNLLTYPGILAAIVAGLLLAGGPPWGVILGGLIAGGALLAMALVSPRGMGMGDVKLAALLGFLLGYPVILVGLFLAFVLGGLISLALLAAGRVSRKDTVAFGPYLALGGILAMVYGRELLGWWLTRV